jgi:isoleucyl-tRNA synthetase
MAYQALPAHVDLAATDHEMIAFWREHKVFAKSLEQTTGGPSYVFYEGPPTATTSRPARSRTSSPGSRP